MPTTSKWFAAGLVGGEVIAHLPAAPLWLDGPLIILALCLIGVPFRRSRRQP